MPPWELTRCECARPQELNTPLHYAAYNGHEDVCRALLSAGAQADAPNEVLPHSQRTTCHPTHC